MTDPVVQREAEEADYVPWPAWKQERVRRELKQQRERVRQLESLLAKVQPIIGSDVLHDEVEAALLDSGGHQ